ncbi:MAG: lipopolysaccharide heptosyltransferase II [Arcobacteraceae bacterium]|nr:lipopolysaccharide heptosyltransferase II [Arcobacteraceae bacterium]
MNKKIFIEIPTWLGDAVMTTPAIQNLVANYPDCELTIFGSSVSTVIFKHHPNVKYIIIDDSKEKGNRYLNLKRLAESAGKVNMAFSFRKNFSTKFLLWFVDSVQKFRYERDTKRQRHQVLRYNDFINKSLSINTNPHGLKIYTTKQKTGNKGLIPLLGINPGATYGSAKRWYSQKFAKVAVELSSQYDIIIFGGPSELEMANDIEELLKKEEIKNYKNLAGKTSVEELITNISSLDLFITNDSGPMHLAAAFKTPTVAIFGPTKYKETHQWQNPNEMIIKKDFNCMPCMKRECPLDGVENHQCMKAVSTNDVLNKISANITDDKKKKKILQKEFIKQYNLEKGTKLILFKANNFKQNGITNFLNIIARINSTNFKAIVCGDDESLKYAKSEASSLQLNDKIIYLNDISIKTADIFILPTNNKKFAKNILKAMESKCAVFAPKTNESSVLLDIFATMSSPDDQNTSHKVDAVLFDNKELKQIQKQNKQNVISWKRKNYLT